MSRESNFAQACMQMATKISQEASRAIDAKNIYFDREYGTNLTDSDVESLGITAAELGAFITFAENIEKFLTNQAISVADYTVTLNKLRTDI